MEQSAATGEVVDLSTFGETPRTALGKASSDATAGSERR
jgi:hypothetical protein